MASAIAACSAACRAFPPGEPSDPYHLFGYRLVWSDEFDTGTLNRDIWNVEVNGDGCGNHELEYYADREENVRVADHNLVLTARREKYKGKDFTSGRINTNNKYAFRYGIVEARIKLPRTADGLWPAFWLMGDDIATAGWPLCGETDILEMGHADGISSRRQDRLFNGAVHWGEDASRHCQSVGARSHRYSLQDGRYHKYYLVWTPQRLQMYVDADPEAYLDIDITKREKPSDIGYSFHKPQFILFNLAVGGDFPGIHDADGITALDNGDQSMLVDYVRIYQKPEYVYKETDDNSNVADAEPAVGGGFAGR